MRISKTFQLILLVIAALVLCCLLYALPYWAQWTHEAEEMAAAQERVRQYTVFNEQLYKKYLVTSGQLGNFDNFVPTLARLQNSEKLLLYGYVDGSKECIPVGGGVGGHKACGNIYTKLIAYDFAKNVILQPFSNNATAELTPLKKEIYVPLQFPSTISNILFLKDRTLLVFDKIIALGKDGKTDVLATEKLSKLKAPKYITKLGNEKIIFWYEEQTNDYPGYNAATRKQHPISVLHATLLNADLDELSFSLEMNISPSSFVIKENLASTDLIVNVIESVDLIANVETNGAETDRSTETARQCIERGGAEADCTGGGTYYVQPKLYRAHLVLTDIGKVSVERKPLLEMKAERSEIFQWLEVDHKYILGQLEAFIARPAGNDGVVQVSQGKITKNIILNPFDTSAPLETFKGCQGYPAIKKLITISKDAWCAIGAYATSLNGACQKVRVWKFNSAGELIERPFAVKATQALSKYDDIDFMDVLPDERMLLVGKKIHRDKYGNVIHYTSDMVVVGNDGGLIQ